ncbi:MAG: hypothetical protein IJR51_04055 [Clostridia bacterium]|nr:hypothetical protein [Clostridia bacterium]MBQ9506307.1 hypothetical protein [Clostridia bacterium]MBR5423290.1 hypothetical protein [Clostridia bacterium]
MNCEECVFYGYDEEYDEYLCTAPMDMDDAGALLQGKTRECPFFTPGDEYTVVRKQN